MNAPMVISLFMLCCVSALVGCNVPANVASTPQTSAPMAMNLPIDGKWQLVRPEAIDEGLIVEISKWRMDTGPDFNITVINDIRQIDLLKYTCKIKERPCEISVFDGWIRVHTSPNLDLGISKGTDTWYKKITLYHEGKFQALLLEALHRGENITPNPPAGSASPSGERCVVTIRNPLVELKSEPSNRSLHIIRVKPGNYLMLDHVITDFGGLKKESWFQIEPEGRRGWIANNSWTIEAKTRSCP